MKPHALDRRGHWHAGHQSRAVGPNGRTLATAFRKSRLSRPAPGAWKRTQTSSFKRSAVHAGPVSSGRRHRTAAIGGHRHRRADGWILGVGSGRPPRDSVRLLAGHALRMDIGVCRTRRARISSARREDLRASITVPRSSGGNTNGRDLYRRIVAFVQPSGYAGCDCVT